MVEDMPLTYIYALNQNAPNPFNSQTRINYQLAKPSNVSLKIYNITGQLVKTLVNDNQTPGYYSANWDGKDGNGTKAASGIYIYRLQAGDYVNTRKMVIIK